MTTRRQFLLASASVSAVAFAGISPVFAGGHGRIGEFSGLSDHITTGRAEVLGDKVVLLDDFELDGAPDARVGLGKDGKYDPATDMGALANLTGEQSYSYPDGVNPDDYNEVYIWCRKFSVPLGVAKLN